MRQNSHSRSGSWGVRGWLAAGLGALWAVSAPLAEGQSIGEPADSPAPPASRDHEASPHQHHDSGREHARHGADHSGHSEHSGHGLRHDFSDAEYWSSRFDAPEREQWQKPGEVIELLQIDEGMTVVDLGAGTGYFLKRLSWAAGDSGRVLALDPETDLVDFMNQRADREALANVEAVQIPYDDPELAPASVDRILIVNTWHHIGERGAYSAKLRRALKAGGRILVVDFTRESPEGPPPEHRLSAEEIIADLEAGGLVARQLSEELPRQFVVEAEVANREP